MNLQLRVNGSALGPFSFMSNLEALPSYFHVPVGGDLATLDFRVTTVKGMKCEGRFYRVWMFPQVRIRKNGCGGELGTDVWKTHTHTLTQLSGTQICIMDKCTCVCAFECCTSHLVLQWGTRSVLQRIKVCVCVCLKTDNPHTYLSMN